jgi:hypothetical protein
MLKNRVINEGAHTGLYVKAHANAWERAQTGRIGRGHIGPGVDSSHE